MWWRLFSGDLTRKYLARYSFVYLILCDLFIPIEKHNNSYRFDSGGLGNII